MVPLWALYIDVKKCSTQGDKAKCRESKGLEENVTLRGLSYVDENKGLRGKGVRLGQMMLDRHPGGRYNSVMATTNQGAENMTALEILSRDSLTIANKVEARQIAQALLTDSTLRIAAAAAKKIDRDLQELGRLSIAI